MGTLSVPMPDMLSMPCFDNGAVDMQEPLRRLAPQIVNAVMDSEAEVTHNFFRKLTTA